VAFDFDPIYLIYLLVAASAGLLAEGVYLLFFSGGSYRKNVNRRLKLLKDEPNRENLLVQLRKERGLTNSGDYPSRSKRSTGWCCNPGSRSGSRNSSPSW
jgi:tight adherence protein B